MELSFCDRCDASIPQSDLDRHVVRVRGGRLLCATCRATERRRFAGRTVLAVVSLLLSALVGAAVAVSILLPRLRAVEAESAGPGRREVRTGADAPVESEIRGLRELVRNQGEALRALKADRKRDDERLARAVEKVAAQVATLAGEVRASAPAAGPPASTGGSAPGPTGSTPAGPKPVPGPRSTKGSPAKPAPPDLATWLPLTDDPDAGVRLSALISLEPSSDPRVTSRARSLLTDADPMVRAEAARMLGRRKDRSALPGLGHLLSDPNVRVRAFSAAAIATIAGPVPGYDATDPEKTREAAAEAWRKHR